MYRLCDLEARSYVGPDSDVKLVRLVCLYLVAVHVVHDSRGIVACQPLIEIILGDLVVSELA